MECKGNNILLECIAEIINRYINKLYLYTVDFI